MPAPFSVERRTQWKDVENTEVAAAETRFIILDLVRALKPQFDRTFRGGRRKGEHDRKICLIQGQQGNSLRLWIVAPPVS